MKLKLAVLSFLVLAIVVVIDLYKVQVVTEPEKLITQEEKILDKKTKRFVLLRSEEVEGLLLSLESSRYSYYYEDDGSQFLDDVEFVIRFKNNSKETINCIFAPSSYICFSGGENGGFGGVTKTTWSINLTPIEKADQDEEDAELGLSIMRREHSVAILPDESTTVLQKLSDLLERPKIKKGKYIARISYKVESNHKLYWVGHVETNDIIISIK